MHILLFAILFCPLTAIQTEDVSDFIKQLDSADSGVRFNAARELTWMGAKAEPATARLLELLGDNEAPFENAIQYFGPRVNDAASGALAEIGEPAVAGLIETLKSEDITIRMKAADTLGKIGPPAARSFPMLRDLILNDPDQWVRFRGIDAIAHLGEDPEIVVPLLDQMKDDEFHSIRSTVLNSLHNADPNGTLAIPILQRELSNADPDLMANAVRGLGLYGAKSHVATEDLIKLLSTDKLRFDSYADVGYHVPVKFDVVAALGKIGPSAKNAIPALIAMAGDESEPARLTQILSAIVRIAPSENAGQQAFALLTTQLEKKSEDAATAIGEVGSDDAITLLTNALEGESSPAVLAFQTSVITALAAHGIRAKASVPMLIRTLRESEPDADGTTDHFLDFWQRQRAIVRGLSEIGAPASPALPELRRLRAEKEDLWLSDTAGEAIWKIENSQTDQRSRSK